VTLSGQETQVYCEPDHYPHAVTAGLYRCLRCRSWHHDGYVCRAPVKIRRWDDPPQDQPRTWCETCEDYHDDPEDCPRALIECGECDTEHERDGDCPREWCDNCDAFHDRDRWGNIECPGWYCESCEEHHDYGDECPYPYCEDCGEHHGEYDGCPAGCDCTSPRLSFTIRNDGEAPLASDTRTEIGLPADEISDTGLAEIRACLLRAWRDSGHDYRDCNVELHSLANSFADALGCQWQTRQGNYTKRLSRHAYQNHGGLKLSQEVMSEIGTIARDHSKASAFEIDVTRDLNRPAEDFYHDGSCWWGSYSESRCALKSNGGFGLRSFQGQSVSGRAWVMPLRKESGGLVPTLDTMTPDAFIVFNGYGDLAGYAPARIMAGMAGWTYKKISFSCDPMYINAGGYLVAPEHIIQDTSTLRLNVPQHASLTTDYRELAHAA
jgi:hypothetical protein